MHTSIFKHALIAGAFALTITIASAQVERLDLATMIAKTDNCVIGTIVEREVFRIDHPVDGPELYFTMLVIDGESLKDGRAMTTTVIFAGGFIDAVHGVHNSEAPSADDTKIGNKVVAFYKKTQNLGGDVAGNALYASHGGLYRTFSAARGTIVQGRGEGYAISANVEVTSLKRRILDLAKPR